MTDIEKETAERFQRDTADHQMTVLHDDGLYRHLRCSTPDSSFYWFEIVTWPGSLAIRGDMGGGYVFSRIDDMFQFFRSDKGRINPHYWSEKLSDCGRSVREYSEDVLRRELDDVIADYAREYEALAANYAKAKAEYNALPASRRWPFGPREPVAPKSPEDYRTLIADYDEDGLLGFDDGARELLRELERDGFVSDTWEWDLTDWDWSFLWACHAIVWAIGQYDAAKRATVTVELPGVSR